MYEEDRAKLKRALVIAVCFFVILLGFIWVRSHGFITISVAGPTTQPRTYELYNQDSGEKTEIRSNGSVIRKLVSRSDYEVRVVSGDKSSVTVSRVDGFLKTTAVAATLRTESSREFVGDNPGPCVTYIRNTLLSSGCSDSLSNTLIHQPATADQPTFSTKIPTPALDGEVEGTITTPEGILVLVQTGSGHQIIKLNDDFSFGTGTTLSGLSADKLYRITPFQTGFIIYRPDSSKVVYYTTINSPPRTIHLGNTSAGVPNLISLETSNEAVVATYSSLDADTISDDLGSGAPQTGKAEVVVYANNRSSHYNFDELMTGARLCGVSRLCALNLDHEVLIYALGEAKPVYKYRVSNVREVLKSAEGLALLTDSGILSFDPVKQSGYFIYQSRSFQTCGLTPINEGYVACVIDSKSNKSALLITPASSNQSDIDKKVFELKRQPGILDVSAYRNYIYITPDLGEMSYDEASNTFGYSASEEARVKSQINDLVDKLKIDRNAYVIIDSLE